MRLLISVRNVAEALVAARGGADFIDLKEPRDGALGGLPVPSVGAIVAALRAAGITLPVSATIGDHAADALDRILARVDAVAACEVTYVKVGVERSPAAPGLLAALAATGHAIVPVFIADEGLEMAHVELACGLGFPGLMVDTAAKRAGSLLDLLPDEALRGFVETVRAAGAMVGVAGALRIDDLPRLAALAPDFAGFRSAVCVGDRTGALDAGRLAALAEAAARCRRPVGGRLGELAVHVGPSPQLDPSLRSPQMGEGVPSVARSAPSPSGRGLG